MDIKDLNKSQLILLMILLSFITSIATGITTVTLMQRAPASITVPINRVVQQTVEKIVPASSDKEVQTVVIKEEDLVVDAISKNENSSFSITREILDADNKIIEISAGKGLVVSKEGVIVGDSTLIYPSGGNYFAKNSNGKFKIKEISSDKGGFAFFQIGDPVDGTSKVSYLLPTFGDLEKMKIGQKILIFGNSISSFIFDGDKNLKMTVPKTNGGSMILNIDGEVLGMASSSESISFVSISSILESLKNSNTETKTE